MSEEIRKTMNKGDFALLIGERKFYPMYLRLINQNPEISDELEKAGYFCNSKKITPKQQDIIFKYLGK